MTEITTFRPLEKISTSELQLEIKLRKGPDWICVGCGYHADGSGQWPCPDCGKRGNWTGGWNVEHPHRFHACRLAWESRICSHLRPIATELCAVGIGQALKLDKLQAEVSMLRSSHDNEVVRRAALGEQLNQLLQQLLAASSAGTLPKDRQAMEEWLLELDREATHA
ncbi:conserved hypothetical protein [Pseudomonas sp. 8Z]|uniref:hypothetical protein n=1 Tax=Pseudomonas sp. 8Z TaxID=2653166 RepID=UPI0012EFAAF8|nr:hypothetical protein [Pseudomonas sp. 8Z]VXC25430.1 conserved hypothetical protein [Pseudomonas sp. 8Z]